ncbi:Galactitol-1-phosphate 5-dehydrogenase [Listeria weihenstephanensis FSL R9-0317]|uniref:Alcohol dehydrogenase n=1 Tax=Listeria weihenstephanensis TaxID=1006155 RepID=A0A1S7FRB7_9LIST|nr:galactitol-1-phosphate 5-dehydrogenase [Listeria weihenstephanensis]AQY49964.1 alcohol dehydrogenase [Listeria weihenstephanensis]EUJ39686.1 Galactitol-1-phosphate 5-dehydrogenase [Listeria weihenstephanensis FSL R9-0317]
MRAAVLYENNEIKAEQVEEAVCGKDEVRVKVMAAGICGSDIHKMQTRWKYPLPAVMGHEFAGVVVEKGVDVTRVAIGERVAGIPLVPCGTCEYCQQGEFSLCENYRMVGSHFHGAFAENVVLKATNVIGIGDMDFEEAAMLEPLAVAMHGVLGIKPELGDTVVVFGIGTIGILVVQCLQLAGVKDIIAVDISNGKLAEASKFGCSYTINPLQEDLAEKVREYTGGSGADIALECAGSKITQEQCLRVTKKKGKIGYLGIAYADVLLPEEAFENIFRRELTLKGFWNSYSAPFPGEEWTTSIAFVNQGRIKLKPLISHRYKVDQTADAFAMILGRKEDYNKVMILPQEE